MVQRQVELCEETRLHVPHSLLGCDLVCRQNVDLLDLSSGTGNDSR